MAVAVFCTAGVPFYQARASNSENSASIRFEDRQPSSGIAFVLNNDSTADQHMIERVLGGVALLDFDHDNFLDIFFTNGARIPTLQKNEPSFYSRLYRNNHDGTFTDMTDRANVRGYGYEMGAATGDFDNDGWADLFVAGVNRNVLYRNKGDGTFEDVTETAGVSGKSPNGNKPWSVAAAWIDYNNDGHLDLFVANYLDWSFETAIKCGKPGKRLSCSP
ncbi:VCBS repeat-containing protein, partial [Acidobacteria bacterium AH-259-O06]|nr:VCBS repeat-containing protein [Acidobacteria bacterium AH-259-O06]